MTPPAAGRQTGHAIDQAGVPALVERAKACDHDAWEALYQRGYPQLSAYAARRLDPDRARDAVAETMARAVAKIKMYEGHGAGGFDGWLFGILRHVVIDAHRAARRDREGPPVLRPIAPAGPLDNVLEQEEADEVRAAFATLAPDDQEVLELRVVAGLSSEEVAAVLGKRPGAIRMAQSRALERLQRRLKERV
ncbi:MAG TPA: RNA polymerase sigma factor [Acidimicrobiia bacterium]